MPRKKRKKRAKIQILNNFFNDVEPAKKKSKNSRQIDKEIAICSREKLSDFEPVMTRSRSRRKFAEPVNNRFHVPLNDKTAEHLPLDSKSSISKHAATTHFDDVCALPYAETKFCKCAILGEHHDLLENLTNKIYEIDGDKLNIQDNNTMDMFQLRNLGHWICKHLMSLRAPFDISDEKLKSFFDGFTTGKINELDLSCSKNLTTESFTNLGQFILKRGINRLILCGCGLTKIHFDALYKEFSADNQPQTMEELDLSYNTTLEPESIKIIVQIAAECKLRKLTLDGCDLNYCHLQNFANCDLETLNQLDISCCENLSEQGFRNLVNIVEKTGVKTLILGACQLRRTDILAFHDEIMKKNQNLQLDELDLSYNPTLEPEDFKTIGQIVAKCEVKKVGLAGCKLSKTHLQNFQSNELKKVSAIDVGDNCLIGTGVSILAEIVKNHKLQEVNICDCMLTKSQLEKFGAGLGKSMVSRLNLSDYDRSPDEAYIKEVCKLLPNVTDVLYLQFKSLDDSCRSLLQIALDELPYKETRIALIKESLTCQRKA